MIIGIDPGHGGTNIGTHHFGVEEENYVLETALTLRKVLGDLGVQCELSRTVNETVSFEERARRLAHADFVLVLHVNAAIDADAAKCRELRTYLIGNDIIAVKAACEIERTAPELIAPTHIHPIQVSASLPDTIRCFNTLNHHQPKPAVLVEMFFATHEISARWAMTPYGKASLVTCLAGGAINAWYSVQVKDPVVAVHQPPPADPVA